MAAANVYVVAGGNVRAVSDAASADPAETAIVPGSLADATGLEDNVITSDGHDYGVRGLRSNVREVASRVKRWSAMSSLTAKRSVGPAYR